ncbi:unnamed protein product [Absidia cylindrospora]
MTSTNHQEFSFFNWLNQSHQRKEVAKAPIYGSPWARPYTTTAAVPPSFHPIASNNNSPLISTPFLDSSADDALSPACFSPYQTLSPHLNHPNRFHHHRDHQHADIAVGQYIDQDTTNTEVKNEPIFTGDPMELLIDKSKAVSTSPALLASDDISTPLFGPIASTFDNDGQQQQHQGSGTLSHDHAFAMDWACYNEGDGFLFHALEGLTNTPTTSTFHCAQKNDQHQYELSKTSSVPSPANDQNHSANPTADNNKNSNTNNTTGLIHTENKATLKGSNKSNKRRRRNSYSSDSSEPDHNKRRNSAKATHPEENEKRHACPICRRKFSRRYNLNTHIRTHNANRIKEFSCDVCGSSFDRKHDRDRHLESVHLGKKSYSCMTCNAAFCRRDALSRHTFKFHGGGGDA